MGDFNLGGYEPAPSPAFLALVFATMGLGAIAVKSCSMEMGRNSKLIPAVMEKAVGDDGVLDKNEAESLADAVGYDGPISNEKGELFMLRYCSHGAYGIVPGGKSYFLTSQRLEDYLR